ncbi:LysR family transcriptional regulator [Roseiconus nitratireducens]|uniref:LysR family transcriptional regulator n=1 Tax=Roseiconus nitratireducens TaxID=2605748 RepID=A0A5M6CWW4_9BACT|nr:LysR family transcriptional regulator [Roseiconus nitratireducens]KAA5539714.1 LysR family transcriptional regulator [Roseiconus nitratireducens]
MEFDQLRYFLQVCQHRSFTRAAEALGISQPALSRSIQKLEAELGQPVLERKNRSLDLTAAGTLLRSRAQQILDLVEDTAAEISDDGRTGRLRVAAIPTIAPYFLPGLLKAFSTKYPEANLIVQEQTTDDLLRSCSQGEIDVGFLVLPVSARYLQIEPLFEEELLLVLPPDHELLSRKQIRLSHLQPYPFVLLSEAHCLSDGIISFCRQRSFQPVMMERTSQLAMVQELVSLSHGISMVPEMARKLDRSKRRVYRSLSGTPPKREIAMIWNPYRFESRLQKAFLQQVRDHVQESATPDRRRAQA